MKTDARRQRTFLCRDELYTAFEARARELECSVDWLIGEAMKRMLRTERSSARPQSLPPPPGSRTPRVTPPPRRLGVVPSAPAGPPPAPPPPPPPSFAPAGTIALRTRDGERIVVDRERFVIGRNARDAHLVVRDPNVSRQHAMVERAEGGWFIVDMASTNGVCVNGAMITRVKLRAGDVIIIGPMSLTVERA